jgi:uncharacterized membrane protein YphA (DoxX/SURF4 family)
MNKKMIIYFISILFISLFLYTGISKFTAYELFRNQLQQSELLTPIARWLIWIVPTVELAIPIMLLIPEWRLLGLYTCFSLMLLFTIYMILLSYYSYYIPCSCGGLMEKIPLNIHILFNGCLTLLALVGIHFKLKLNKENHKNKLTVSSQNIAQ